MIDFKYILINFYLKKEHSLHAKLTGMVNNIRKAIAKSGKNKQLRFKRLRISTDFLLFVQKYF